MTGNDGVRPFSGCLYRMDCGRTSRDRPDLKLGKIAKMQCAMVQMVAC